MRSNIIILVIKKSVIFLCITRLFRPNQFSNCGINLHVTPSPEITRTNVRSLLI